MGRKRLIIEMGVGIDMHGEDVTKAAQRAVKDAVSKSCLCGLKDIFEITDPHEMHIKAKIGSPYPEQADTRKIKEAIPFGTADIEVVQGGLIVQGLHLPQLAKGSNIVMAVAALTVYIEV